VYINVTFIKRSRITTKFMVYISTTKTVQACRLIISWVGAKKMLKHVVYYFSYKLLRGPFRAKYIFSWVFPQRCQAAVCQSVSISYAWGFPDFRECTESLYPGPKDIAWKGEKEMETVKIVVGNKWESQIGFFFCSLSQEHLHWMQKWTLEISVHINFDL